MNGQPPESRPFLSRLTLRRFRNHTSYEQDFDAGLTIFTGPNGAGKTNILEAISALNPGRGLRGAAADDMAQAPSPIGWSIEAKLDTDQKRSQIKVVYNLATRKRLTAIDSFSETQTALAKHVRMVWLTPAMDRLWIEGAAGRRRFLDRITLGFAPNHGEQSALHEKAMRERNKLLKDDDPSRAWLDAVEARMAAHGVAINANRELALKSLAEAENRQSRPSEADFPIADLVLTGPLHDAPGLNENSYRERLRRDRFMDAQAGRTLFGPHRTDLAATYRSKGVTAALCSTGEQKALLVSILLAAAESIRRQHGAAPVVLLDEVCAHLDPNRRCVLFQALLDLGAQCFLTGAQISDFASVSDHARILAIGN